MLTPMIMVAIAEMAQIDSMRRFGLLFSLLLGGGGGGMVGVGGSPLTSFDGSGVIGLLLSLNMNVIVPQREVNSNFEFYKSTPANPNMVRLWCVIQNSNCT